MARTLTRSYHRIAPGKTNNHNKPSCSSTVKRSNGERKVVSMQRGGLGKEKTISSGTSSWCKREKTSVTNQSSHKNVWMTFSKQCLLLLLSGQRIGSLDLTAADDETTTEHTGNNGSTLHWISRNEAMPTIHQYQDRYEHEDRSRSPVPLSDSSENSHMNNEMEEENNGGAPTVDFDEKQSISLVQETEHSENDQMRELELLQRNRILYREQVRKDLVKRAALLKRKHLQWSPLEWKHEEMLDAEEQVRAAIYKAQVEDDLQRATTKDHHCREGQ